MSGPARLDLPPIPDFRKQRFFDEKHERARAGNRERFRKWYNAHYFERSMRAVLEAPPIGRPALWEVRILLDTSDTVIFVAACRKECGSIQNIRTGVKGKETTFVSDIGRREATIIAKTMVLNCQPIGNKASTLYEVGKGKSVGARRTKEEFAYYSYW
jgi:hypothetical protein